MCDRDSARDLGLRLVAYTTLRIGHLAIDCGMLQRPTLMTDIALQEYDNRAGTPCTTCRPDSCAVTYTIDCAAANN
jgi:hypothetical protein